MKQPTIGELKKNYPKPQAPKKEQNRDYSFPSTIDA